MMSPRTGRPKSSNPKDVDIKVRVDADTNLKLVEFAAKHNISRTEVIRQGIEKILSENEK